MNARLVAITAQVAAIRARVAGFEILNAARERVGSAPGYHEGMFFSAESELDALAKEAREMGTSAFEGWAIVELMGHRRIAGRVSETEIAGAKLLRVDIPGDGPDDYATQFVGGASIYCLTPTTEEMARAAARSSRPEPVTRWELPKPEPAPQRCGVGTTDGECIRVAGHDGDHDAIGF